jgi:hypothetical protein
MWDIKSRKVLTLTGRFGRNTPRWNTASCVGFSRAIATVLVCVRHGSGRAVKSSTISLGR